MYREMTDHAMKFVATPQMANVFPVADALLADYEVSRDPVHITIVGPKDSWDARQLFQAAASYPSGYKRLEWMDLREGHLPNPDAQYPALARPAAFLCSNHACSSPIFKAEDIRPRADRLTGVETGISTLASHPWFLLAGD